MHSEIHQVIQWKDKEWIAKDYDHVKISLWKSHGVSYFNIIFRQDIKIDVSHSYTL